MLHKACSYTLLREGGLCHMATTASHGAPRACHDRWKAALGTLPATALFGYTVEISASPDRPDEFEGAGVGLAKRPVLAHNQSSGSAVVFTTLDNDGQRA